MLQRTRGRELVFHTALALYDARCDVLRERVDITTVRMRNLTDGQIAAYLEREPDAIHCAGGCMSEKLGGALIARIDSTDPNALIGLPLFDLVDLLLEAGVEVL